MRMNNKTTNTIDGYLVELEIISDIEPQSDCYISKGDYCSSLEYMMNNNAIFGATEYDELPVSLDTRNKIEDWALNNGY